jgi:hypothetical protein
MCSLAWTIGKVIILNVCLCEEILYFFGIFSVLMSLKALDPNYVPSDVPVVIPAEALEA